MTNNNNDDEINTNGQVDYNDVPNKLKLNNQQLVREENNGKSSHSKFKMNGHDDSEHQKSIKNGYNKSMHNEHMNGNAKTEMSKEERIEQIAESYKDILETIGEDVDREGLLKTPQRAAKAFLHFTKGYNENLNRN